MGIKENERGNLPGEVEQSLSDIEQMGHNDLAEYFERLAVDHIDSGSFATAADYIEAADRIRRIER